MLEGLNSVVVYRLPPLRTAAPKVSQRDPRKRTKQQLRWGKPVN
ncbi:MAG: hypothetical protein R3E89_16455 [Thiolinea sp.]